jgi:UDP-2,3-diacylglucosamine pyrophosphatase LpxH
MNEKRNLDVVVISDVHLGTTGCRASELLKYLKSIRPKIVVLNGDIIDVWQFRKKFFPKNHLKVIKHLIGLASGHTSVYYITGNHDELFRKFNGLKIGKLMIVNDLKLELSGQKIWFFHGDIFDVVMQYSKWLAKLGAIGYDLLILLNTAINWLYRVLGFEPVSFSKKIKNSVKGAVKYINSFEESAASVAASKGFDTVVCGHIHQAERREMNFNQRMVTYLNSGDWIENLTALEYHKGEWRIFNFREDFVDEPVSSDAEYEQLVDFEPKQLFKNLLYELQH